MRGKGKIQDLKGYQQFMRHLRGAGRRGIAFKFTYEQWVAWWESELGTDWLEKRGTGTEKYCMARKGDKGPYAVWNVKCITHAQNSREQYQPKKLTKEQVIAIYGQVRDQPQGLLNKLAKQYGVRRENIKGIRDKVIWSNVTNELDVEVV